MCEQRSRSVHPRRATRSEQGKFAQPRESRREEVRGGGPGVSPDIVARARAQLEGQRVASRALSGLPSSLVATFPSSFTIGFLPRLDVTAARSLIRYHGRVLVGDVIVTGKGRGGGGEGGATERGWWMEYPCLCAKTVALAVKCSYVGHANEGRCVLRCCPKCVEPSAPRRCASSLLRGLGELLFTLLAVPRRRNLSNGSALPACTCRAAVDWHLTETLLMFGIAFRRDSSSFF